MTNSIKERDSNKIKLRVARTNRPGSPVLTELADDQDAMSVGADQASNSLTTSYVKALQAEIDATRWELWFSGQIDIRVSKKRHLSKREHSSNDPGSATKIEIRATSQFALDRIRNQFDGELRATAARICGTAKIKYCVKPEAAGNLGEPQTGSADLSPGGNAAAAELDAGILESSSRFASAPNGDSTGKLNEQPAFVFCENNSLAQSSFKEIAQNPGQISPVLFHGPTGCGKSLLLKTVKRHFRRTSSAKRIVMMSAEQFTSAYLGALNGQGLPMFRRHYRDLDLLLIDDIQFFRGKRATTSEFQHTVDCLLSANRQIVLTSDRPPLEMDFLSQELVTRLSGGLVCPVRFPDRQARIRIANDFSSQRKFDFADDVLEWVADRFPNDVRRMSGALNRLRLISVTGESNHLSVDQAEADLQDLIQTDQHQWSLGQIEQVVCKISGITKSEIRSTSRKKRICTARMLAMWLSRQYTRSALSEIGTHFGGRSHSTVIAATRKVDGLIENGKPVQFANSQCSVKEFIDRVGRSIGEAG